MSNERRNPERPHDWLEVTLGRMEESELRHSAETKRSLADVLKQLQDHIAEDVEVQGQLRGDVRSLLETRTHDVENRTRKQAWLIALSSLSGGAMLKLLDQLWPPKHL